MCCKPHALRRSQPHATKAKRKASLGNSGTSTPLTYGYNTGSVRMICLTEVHGPQIPPDALTKHVELRTLDSHMDRMDMTFFDGRATAAPKLP